MYVLKKWPSRLFGKVVFPKCSAHTLTLTVLQARPPCSFLSPGVQAPPDVRCLTLQAGLLFRVPGITPGVLFFIKKKVHFQEPAASEGKEQRPFVG